MPCYRVILFILYPLILSQTSEVHAASTALDFDSFLSVFLEQSPSAIRAQQDFASAKRQGLISKDVAQGSFTATPSLSHLTRVIRSAPVDETYNRALDMAGTYEQQFSSGTQIRVRGQEFIAQSNPLFQAVDRVVSLGVQQDLINNGLGYSQKRQKHLGQLQLELGALQFRNSEIQICEEAFGLYVDAYVQQERWRILENRMTDAKRALANSRRLYKEKLINKVDLLSAESDFIQTQNDMDQARQLLLNGQNQIAIYIPNLPLGELPIASPDLFLTKQSPQQDEKTLLQEINAKQVASSELEIERVKSNNRGNLDLAFEVGKREGRRIAQNGFNGFSEDYINANLNYQLPTFNKTLGANMDFALTQQRNAVLEKVLTERTQKIRTENFIALASLYDSQVKSSLKRKSLLAEKQNRAYQRMKAGRLEFENYLLHRNAFRDHQINHLSLLKNLWTSKFSVFKETTGLSSKFCSVRAPRSRR